MTRPSRGAAAASGKDARRLLQPSDTLSSEGSGRAQEKSKEVNPGIVERKDDGPGWGLVGAVISAVGASICCVRPLLLLALGIGGAWVGNLTAMERYRPYWMAATLVFLALAFFRIYRKPREVVCIPGSTCSSYGGRRNKIILWIVTGLVLGLLTLPYLISYAYAEGTEEAAPTRQAPYPSGT